MLVDGTCSAVEISPLSHIRSGDIPQQNKSQTQSSASTFSQQLYNATPVRSSNAPARFDLAERPRAIIETGNGEMMSKMTDLMNMVKDIHEKQIIILAMLDQIPGTSLNNQSELELTEDLALPIQSVDDMADLAGVLKNDRSKRRKLVSSVHVNLQLLYLYSIRARCINTRLTNRSADRRLNPWSYSG